ncbi:MAG: L,D-transpeptidase family protein [Bacteroidales bacterium]|nr:L,D-transpeptidase family protein [Bacteroidales bacterium]
MPKFLLLIALWLLSTLVNASSLQPLIKQFIDNKPVGSRYEIENEYLFSSKVLPRFYTDRDFQAAWIEQQTLGKNGLDLLNYIRNIDSHGLRPEDYHLALIEKFVHKLLSFKQVSENDLVSLDMLLTDAFMLLGSQLYFGKVDPDKEGADWKIQRKEPELKLDMKLSDAISAKSLPQHLDSLSPRNAAYWKLKELLAYYNKLEQFPWPNIKSAKSVKPYDTAKIIPEVRKRLMQFGYQLTDSLSDVYDDQLIARIKQFQKERGLQADGAIGKGTLEALNRKPAQLSDDIRVNMERLRWLPMRTPDRFILVNIANFELDMISMRDTIISLKAIVGKEYRKTPVFNRKMTYLVFSPTWTVPPTILRNDVIPELLKGPEYLQNKNMTLLRHDGTEVAYSDIDWSKVTKKNFPYMVRQNPGPENALGRVKFMFPNEFNVYIHDTPTRGLFAKEERALSSGCVRVERPFDLAVKLLADMPEWTDERISKAMNRDTELRVNLKTPIDVVLIYLTAWTDGNNRFHNRKDIYKRDKMVLNALNQKPTRRQVR